MRPGQAAKVDLAFRETLEKPIEMEVLRLTKDARGVPKAYLCQHFSWTFVKGRLVSLRWYFGCLKGKFGGCW